MALPQVLLSELNGGRVDLLLWWRDHKLVIECDGFTFHKDEEKFISDRQRDRTLVAAGYEVMRFAGKELTDHAPACAIAVIKHVFDNWGFYKAYITAEELEPDN